ncbi:ACT domain-containing protein [Iocasia frigidifontis]|uniref:ACT domain-containing protein n=1 Tax=Iocasia fonsfrigidae TaxID=2682810 RepID=A0A8A7K7K6_9FIRM|nr:MULTISPECIES: ACT domain-containing protein [Halanaerobiaceae]AZO94219.1 ACT domain-containing protein [Halocella sp. SP3-1]QTL97170.1 ACT domain-containing protein [Iocasia fonsfrigidae]
MFIKQLSVFLENKSGRLTELTDILGKEGINMSALSIAETSEFGIIRVVTSDPEKALKVLKENHFSVNLTDVICLAAPNEPGALARALKVLSNKGISVEYMYAFSTGDKALVVIRTEKLAETVEALKEHKMELLKASELYEI